MNRILFPMCLLLVAARPALPQSSPQSIVQLMEHPPIQQPAESALRLRQYLLQRIPAAPHPASAAEWTSESAKLRRHLLDNVVFYGWPQEWVNAPLKVEDLGVSASGPGYRIRKLRYEIVPGFFSSPLRRCSRPGVPGSAQGLVWPGVRAERSDAAG